jgi:hypothetical protein
MLQAEFEHTTRPSALRKVGARGSRISRLRVLVVDDHVLSANVLSFHGKLSWKFEPYPFSSSASSCVDGFFCPGDEASPVIFEIFPDLPERFDAARQRLATNLLNALRNLTKGQAFGAGYFHRRGTIASERARGRAPIWPPMRAHTPLSRHA